MNALAERKILQQLGCGADAVGRGVVQHVQRCFGVDQQCWDGAVDAGDRHISIHENLHSVKEHDHSVSAIGRNLRQPLGRVEVIQRPVYQQFAQQGQLLNRQRHIAARAFKFGGEVGGHDVERGQGFTGVTEQGFGVDIRDDRENVADRVGAAWVAKAGADAAFGDFGEFG